jgi:hypothetical protein
MPDKLEIPYKENLQRRSPILGEVNAIFPSQNADTLLNKQP